MFTLSHKFNAFLGENKKRPKNQKVTTNNEGKRNKETRGGGRQKEKSTEKLQIKKIVAMEMIMLFIRRFQLKKKKRIRGRGNKTKKKESKETDSKILFDFQQCLDHKNIRRKEKNNNNNNFDNNKTNKKNKQVFHKTQNQITLNPCQSDLGIIS